jgi:flagellar FliL protein
MIVNLSDASGHSYLRAAISLRIKGEPHADEKGEKKEAKAEEAVATSLRDTTLAVLSGESAESLLIAGGREALKAKLLQEFKLRNVDAVVLEVYFTEFLVQRG